MVARSEEICFAVANERPKATVEKLDQAGDRPRESD